jgi:hypothetical protein
MSSERMWSAIDQPTTRRLKAWSTTARWALPHGWVLRHVHHLQPVGLGAVKVRFIKPPDTRLSPGGCSRPSSAVDPEDPGLPLPMLDPLAHAPKTLAEAQFDVDPRRAIGAPAHPLDVDDGVGEVAVGPVPVRPRGQRARRSRRGGGRPQSRDTPSRVASIRWCKSRRA